MLGSFCGSGLLCGQKKKIEIIIHKKFVKKSNPGFNKAAIINLEKIFEHYNEISILDISRILTIHDLEKLTMWIQSLKKYPGISLDDYLVKVKITQDSVRKFIPDIVKNFEENFILDLDLT